MRDRCNGCMDTNRFRRANGSPTCHGTREPIGPGQGPPDRALSDPRHGGGGAPTAAAPGRHFHDSDPHGLQSAWTTRKVTQMSEINRNRNAMATPARPAWGKAQ